MQCYFTGSATVYLVIIASLFPGAVLAQGDPRDLVLVNGIMSDQGNVDSFSRYGSESGTDWSREREAFCDAIHQDAQSDESLIMALMGALPRAAADRLGEAVAEANDRICNAAETLQMFNVIYASCAMYMQNGEDELLIKIPPGRDAVMEAYSPTSKGVRMNLTRISRDVSAVKNLEGAAPSVTRTGASGEHLDQVTYEYDFEFESKGSMVPDMPLNMGQVTLKSSGSAWLAQDVPGHRIATSFYETFANEIQSGGATEQLMGGLVRQMAILGRNGFPLEIHTTTKVSLRGGPLAAMSRSSTSSSFVTGVAVLPYENAEGPLLDLCNHTLERSGRQFEDVSEAMEGATGSEQSPETQAAMQQMESAMADVSPEQRAMLQQMGVPVPAAAGTNPSNAQAVSAALQSGDAVETAQNYLEYLGYEISDAKGDFGLDTQIAIAQFQAEAGFPVSDSLTTELLKQLAFAVDRR